MRRALAQRKAHKRGGEIMRRARVKAGSHFTGGRRWSGRFLWPVAVAALIAGVCSACGSSNKSSAGTTSSPSTSGAAGAASQTTTAQNTSCPSAPGVTPTEVKVGVMYDQTGANSAFDSSFGPGVKAAFDAANASGGVDGRQIVESVANNASNPGGAVQVAEGLVQSNGVFAIVNGSTSTATMFPYLTQANIPEFDASASFPSFATAPNLFSVSGAYVTTSANGALIGKFLQQNGVRTMAIFDSGTPTGIAGAHAMVTGAKNDGISVVYENDAITQSAFDATSIALRLKQLNPDAVVLPMAEPPSNSIILADIQQGFNPKVTVQSAAYAPSTLTAGISGTWTQTNFTPYLGDISQLSQSAQAFRNVMAKYSPQLTNLGFYAVSGYATAELFLHALQLAGNCPTQATVISKMRAESSYNPGGMLASSIQFTPGITPDGNPANCSYFIKITSNSFVTPSSPTCV
jgi:ABC-type branched-subunit amino acid transport system substrate-binding protein